MIRSIHDCAGLYNGVKMPWFGLGVYKAKEGEEVKSAVKTALDVGYRSIDTAAFYENEKGVGQAIREYGIPREEVFITTKVWNSDQGYESTLQAFEKSRKELAVDYIDLYLIHWPGKDKYNDTWKALEKLYREGHVRAIGVSNFQIHHLEDLISKNELVPMVNQIEYHPRLTQKELHEYCSDHNIMLEAWSPLMRGQILDNEVIVSLAKKYNKTPAQIILRWDLQKGVITIPKSVSEHRIRENAHIYDFAIAMEDMAKIDSLNKNERVGPDPDSLVF